MDLIVTEIFYFELCICHITKGSLIARKEDSINEVEIISMEHGMKEYEK